MTASKLDDNKFYKPSKFAKFWNLDLYQKNKIAIANSNKKYKKVKILNSPNFGPFLTDDFQAIGY